MNLESLSDEEEDSSTSTVLSGHEGVRHLERMMLASSTPRTLDDSEAPSDVDWGHVRPAPTDFLGQGETEIPEPAARQSVQEHTPLRGGAEPRYDQNITDEFTIALSRYNIGVITSLDFQEASADEENGDSCTEESVNIEPSEDESIESDADMFPGSDQIKEHAMIEEELTGQARADEILRQCHEAGIEIDGYGGRYITD